MKQQINIGVACLARKTFDYGAAFEIYGKIQEDLKNVENVNFEFIDELVIEVKDAEKASAHLSRKNLDGLILIAGTFHLGHLVLIFNKNVRCPILLWGLNELPYDGGKIRLNSVCGVNLDASNLYKAGTKDYHVVIGDEVDEDWIDAIRIKKTFSSGKLGIVGYRAKGFFNLDVDELDLHNKTGILLDHFELKDVFDIPVPEESINKRVEEFKQLFDVSAISDEQLNKVAELSLKLENLMENNEIDALAIRCWPEFARDYGISPCAAMSFLQSKNRVLACEGDILAAMSMLAHVAIGAETPFLADFSQVDLKENFSLLWHCGVAPCNLWDAKCVRSLDPYFAGGKGVTADFVMKPGPLSILRLDYAPGEYRIFLQRAKGLPMEKELKGTYLKATFEDGVETVLEKIIYNGIAHHISVVYGDYIKPFLIYAKLAQWKVID